MTTLIGHTFPGGVILSSDSEGYHKSGRREILKNISWGLAERDVFFAGTGDGNEVYVIAEEVFKEYPTPPNPSKVASHLKSILERYPSDVRPIFLIAGLEDGRPSLYDTRSISLTPLSESFAGDGGDYVYRAVKHDMDHGRELLHMPLNMTLGFYRNYLLLRSSWESLVADTRPQIRIARKDGACRSIFHSTVPLNEGELEKYLAQNFGHLPEAKREPAKLALDELYKDLTAVASRIRRTDAGINSIDERINSVSLRRHKLVLHTSDEAEGGKGVTERLKEAVASLAEAIKGKTPEAQEVQSIDEEIKKLDEKKDRKLKMRVEEVNHLDVVLNYWFQGRGGVGKALREYQRVFNKRALDPLEV